jgi:putative ABC transport system substrate-binding protein
VFRQALRELGYIEGKNVSLEARSSEGKNERFPALVAELIQLKVDVLVSTNTVAIRAAKKVTNAIPIIMVTNQDPVATGFINSLAHPGGNVTGVTTLTRDLTGKRLELFKELVPKVSCIGIFSDANSPSSTAALKDYEAAVGALKLRVQVLEVRDPNPDLLGVLDRALTKEPVDGVIAVRASVINLNSRRIADLAIKKRLPSMFERGEYVQAGGLVSYANSDTETFKRAAVLVDKILKGAKPEDLPVEFPTKFELVINLNTAKQIGLTVPPNVLARADRVIK